MTATANNAHSWDTMDLPAIRASEGVNPSDIYFATNAKTKGKDWATLMREILEG